MVILKNKRLDLFEATEYHDLVCRRRDHCLCTNTIVPGPSGKHMTLRAPRSFRVLGKTESEPMDSAILLIPQVKEAIKLGWLERIDVEDAPAKPAPATPVGGKSKFVSTSAPAKAAPAPEKE